MYKNVLTMNQYDSLTSESIEYYTEQKPKKITQQNIKNQARNYYMIFSKVVINNVFKVSKIMYEGKICLLLTIGDITNQKIIQEKSLVDNVKNKIFKSFTHELKNPLNCKVKCINFFSPYVFV